MSGDHKECRKHAVRCGQLAMAVHTPQLRLMFLEPSKNWENQLEEALARIHEGETIRSNVRESLNDTRRLSSLHIWNKPVVGASKLRRAGIIG
jgi:hypothetical protein